MPWQQVSIMDQRREFVRLAMQEEVNRRKLRRFGIHPIPATSGSQHKRCEGAGQKDCVSPEDQGTCRIGETRCIPTIIHLPQSAWQTSLAS
jgi:hypothetical protein